jgi:hypothetical protein
MYKKE